MGLGRRLQLLLTGTCLALLAFKVWADDAFAEVDRHALAADKAVEGSVDSLAAYLAKGAHNDTEKARAVYRWMADRVDYDVKGYFGGNLQAVPADGILHRREAGCDGYATLFEALAKRMGLEVVSVAGYAKGYGHKNASTFERPNHAWNAVRIDGRWLWVDPTWGAGFVKDGAYVRRLAEHFFLVEPDRWVLTHLPATPLPHLPAALPKTQFEVMPNPDISLLSYRLPGALLLSALGQPNFKGFVETFEQPPQLVEIESVPLHYTLPAGAPTLFKFKSQVFEEIVAVAGSTWLPFVHQGQGFELALTPPKGPLQIAGRRPGEREYLPFLAYEVE